jgi:molecular chaperone GrpE
LEEERDERINLAEDESEAEPEGGEETGREEASGGEGEAPSADDSATTEAAEAEASPEKELADLNDKYIRLYAEFENYKKRVLKDREELVKYANETILHDLLPSIDNLEIALQHAGNDMSEGLVKGVEASLREFRRTTEKFGLKPIEALGNAFDPSYHHAMSQVERDDLEENTVVEEFRRGYIYGGKVLRASLVAVSCRPSSGKTPEEDKESSNSDDKEE